MVSRAFRLPVRYRIPVHPLAHWAGVETGSGKGARMSLRSSGNRVLAFVFFSLMVMLPAVGVAQSPAKKDSSEAVKKGIDLALRSNCVKAMDLFDHSLDRLPPNELKYQGELAMARCAMSLNRSTKAVQTLLMLGKDYPTDPEVLFLTAHYYSELASRAAQELTQHAPSSPQAHQLQAENLESEGKWEEATAEYNAILKLHPDYPGIHYRLARIFLLEPDSADHTQRATEQLNLELKVNPTNASAEFMLGEIARRSGDWNSAAAHFSRASTLDLGFAEAFLGLGIALNSAGKHAAAIPSLEKYVTMEPNDPAGHYQLAIAYSRTGLREKAQRQLDLQRQAEEENPQHPAH
jgi:predicted Zn-dependent protease